ncbi:hypothetical protein SAMN05660710_03769 [Paracoccus tibetensis]|uniref:Uncharacterized protein n=1 Tax=Paracoccus tibetensis TaxID=336292 RepID=A0A1G5K865_9RHOB|nr:hypothetical protein SAMN05660710_03769 [Paracoccus tibetensis]
MQRAAFGPPFRFVPVGREGGGNRSDRVGVRFPESLINQVGTR